MRAISRPDVFSSRVQRPEISNAEVFEMSPQKMRVRLCGIAAATVAAMLAGCGGAGATASTAPNGSTPQTVTGIATPSSVAIVTATGN